MREQLRINFALMLFAGFSLCLPASAGDIGFGVWYQFPFGDVGEFATGCFPADAAGPTCVHSMPAALSVILTDAPPWTFTSPPDFILTVRDAFELGDEFEVLDFGVPIGTTSAFPANRGRDCGPDPYLCLADQEGEFNLPAGPHSITIRTVTRQGGTPEAYFLLADFLPLPEPSGVVMLLVALPFVVILLRRRLPRGRRLDRSAAR